MPSWTANSSRSGVRNGWTQPIINRINMLSTGVRTDLGVKIFGNDLNVLKDLAVQAEGILKTVHGAADVVAERVTGGNYIDIDIDREAAARYGVKVGDIQDVIETALGGEMLTTAVEGREPLPDPHPLPARLPGQHPGNPADAGLRDERRPAGAAVAGDEAQGLHRRAGDQQRRRAAALPRLPQCARPRHGRLRHRGEDRCWKNS